MTHLSLFRNAIHQKVHSYTLPKLFSFWFFPVRPPRVPLNAALWILSSDSISGYFCTTTSRHPSPPLYWLSFSFSSRFLYLSSFSNLTSAPFNHPYCLTHPAHSKKISLARLGLFSAHVARILLLMCKQTKLFYSISFTLFAYKHISRPQAQKYSTLTTQISHFILLLLSNTGYTHSITFSDGPRLSSLNCHSNVGLPGLPLQLSLFAVSRFLPWLDPRASLCSLAIVSLSASSSLFSSSFFLANSSLSLRLCFFSSHSLPSEARWRNIFPAVKLIFLSTAQSATMLSEKTCP